MTGGGSYTAASTPERQPIRQSATGSGDSFAQLQYVGRAGCVDDLIDERAHDVHAHAGLWKVAGPYDRQVEIDGLPGAKRYTEILQRGRDEVLVSRDLDVNAAAVVVVVGVDRDVVERFTYGADHLVDERFPDLRLIGGELAASTCNGFENFAARGGRAGYR
jgi:hypothetical protein